MVARALGVGSAQGPTDVVETGLVVAAGILVLLIAAGWFWFTRPAMSPEFVPMRRLGARIGSLGCATIGLAILVAAFGLFGASIHNAGVSALIALVGAIVVMAGVLISWIGMRRA
jgi:hypothetical protein